MSFTTRRLLSDSTSQYRIPNSLRFRSSASAYLSRTPAVAGNRTTWTWSGWVKRGKLGTETAIFTGGNWGVGVGANFATGLIFTPSDQLAWYWASSDGPRATTTAVFRDTSAWYHIVIKVSSSVATISVNGTQVLTYTGTGNGAVNAVIQHALGSSATSLDYYFDGYMTEVNFIDGQALDPLAFGYFSPKTGVWTPARYTGTYGTNGFYLPFTNNNTVEALGYDYGNGGPELITNGMFVSNVNGWTVAPGLGGTPSITWQATHTARISNPVNSQRAAYYQAISTVIGQTYYVQCHITNINIGLSTRTASIKKGDDAAGATNQVIIGSVPQSAGSGWVRGTFTATSTTTYIIIDADIYNTGTQGADFSHISVTTGAYKNSWNPFNISLTSGTTYDSMIDTPTPYNDGGYGRGNYAVLNPLHYNTLGTVVSEGNLVGTSIASNTSPYYRSYPSTLNVSSGKWYCELTVGSNNNGQTIGITSSFDSDGTPSTNSYGYNFWDQSYVVNNLVGSSYGVRATAGQVIGMAVNLDGGTIEWFVNGVSQGQKSGIVAGNYFIVYWTGWSVSGVGQFSSINFGQRPFAYTPPTGFKTLCTQNLPTPAIINPAQFMAATTYAGNGSTQTIANTVNNRSFQPDLVWIKGRSAATDHALYDSVRGATKDLVSNSTAAETTQATGLTTFGSNGFTIGSLAKLNTNAQTYVAWQWKAGDSTVTNTAGTITSQVDANPTAGFSIVSYTGTGTTGTVGHGLGSPIKMHIVKNRTTDWNWNVWFEGFTTNQFLRLNTNDSIITFSNNWGSGTFNSNVFSVSNNGAWNNSSGNQYVAYCFAEVDGFSKFGSYTGNGSANGPFIYCGFRPKWMMFKRTDAGADHWAILDSGRDALNVVSGYVNPNNSAVEFTQASVDFTSNGIKIRNVGTGANISGSTYIFAAFAEAPFKYALAR